MILMNRLFELEKVHITINNKATLVKYLCGFIIDTINNIKLKVK